MDDAREQHLQKIRQIEAELETAKDIHRKDLFRHLYRLKKELKIYDFYHRQRG